LGSEKVLVTGGAGFIGSHLVDTLLERGHAVRVFDNLDPQVHGAGAQGPPTYLSREAEFIQGDVRDAEALDAALGGVEVVFHQAAAVGVGQSMYDIHRYTNINVLGTAALLELLISRHRDHVRKLLVASSMSIYGEGKYVSPESGLPILVGLRGREQMQAGQWEHLAPGGNWLLRPAPCDETKPLQPTSIYAINKRDQEEMALVIGREYGIPTVALRYFNVYGPRQALSNPYTGVGAIFSSRLLNGKGPLIFEDGRQTRDLTHVRDIARANTLAMERDESNGHAINIGTGLATSVLQVAELLRKRLHPGRGDDPALAPKIVGKFRAGDIRHCFADISKARRLLGFKPEILFERGVDDLIEWVRSQTAEDRTQKAYEELVERRLV